MYADLHIHTNYSDGIESVEKIEQMSVERGVKIIAITDHDTLEGIKAFSRLKSRIKVIPGIELTITSRLHILGYYIDENNKKLNAVLNEMQVKRGMWIIKLVKGLSNEYSITIGEVRKKYGELTLHSVSEYLMNLEECNLRKKEIYDKYFWNIHGDSRYGSFPAFSLEQAITLIKDAKGFSVLAHPSLLFDDKRDAKDILDNIIGKGLSGIEVYHVSNYKLGYMHYLKEYAFEKKILVVGGSDFHGDKNKRTQIGEYGLNENDWIRFETSARELVKYD